MRKTRFLELDVPLLFVKRHTYLSPHIYVDKTVLYMQSLWTVHPDGTNETALFKNNMAKPTAAAQSFRP